MRCSRWKLAAVSAFALAAIHCDDWHDWDDVFDRQPTGGTRAWTGGDGAVAVPLPGNRTVWLFGDSLVTGYDSTTGNRTGLKELANNVFGNTIGYQTNSSSPSPSQIQFYARSNNAVAPITSSASGAYSQYFSYGMLGLPAPAAPWGFWPNGGMCARCADNDASNDRLIVALSEIVQCNPSLDGSCFEACDPGESPCTRGFKAASTAIAAVSGIGLGPTNWQVTATTKITSNVTWGVAYFEEASFVYIYGTELAAAQHLYLARSTVANLLTPSQWQYWVPAAGGAGSFQTLASTPGISQLKVVAPNIGPVPSVSRITRHGITRYVLVHDRPANHFVYVRTSPSLTSWPSISALTPKVDLAAMDSSIQWIQYARAVQGTCTAVVHNGEQDWRACGESYHGTAHPHISPPDGSSLNFSYIVPHGPDETATNQDYYRPKFGLVPLDNLPDWCAAAGQFCWYGIGRHYNTRSIAQNAEQHFTFDVSQAAGLAFPHHAFSAEILDGTGNPDLYVRFGSSPPTTSVYHCRSNSSGAGESCRLPVASGVTTARVMVRGASAGTYSLRVAYAGS